MKLWPRCIFLGVLITGLLGSPVSALAAKARVVQQEVVKLLKSKQTILQELENMEQQLVAIEAALKQLRSAEENLLRELAASKVALSSCRLQTRKIGKKFKQRLIALYKLTKRPPLILGLRELNSFTDYLRTKRFLGRIAKHDQALKQRYLGEEITLQERTQELAVKQQNLQQLQREGRRLRDLLSAARQERLVFGQAVRQEKQLARRVAVEQEQATSLLTSLLPPTEEVAESTSLASERGHLPWPVSGKVLQGFGTQVESAFGTVTTHHGLSIRAVAGSPVQAVAAGRVSYAGWFKGYGQIVILDHDGGYASLVAHLARINVEVGDDVESGALLGSVGDTGSLRGTMLYFEWRYQGKPLDPALWLRK